MLAVLILKLFFAELFFLGCFVDSEGSLVTSSCQSALIKTSLTHGRPYVGSLGYCRVGKEAGVFSADGSTIFDFCIAND
jgi:hypothetical protein